MQMLTDGIIKLLVAVVVRVERLGLKCQRPLYYNTE